MVANGELYYKEVLFTQRQTEIVQKRFVRYLVITLDSKGSFKEHLTLFNRVFNGVRAEENAEILARKMPNSGVNHSVGLCAQFFHTVFLEGERH